MYEEEKRIKATIDRIDHKNRISESLSEQRDIMNMKRKEINYLRKFDV